MSDLISREAVMVSLMQYASGKKTIGQCIDEVPSIQPKTDVLDKIRAEIIKYEGDCQLSVDEYPSCKECTDNMFETIYGILDKYKAESEG